MSTRPETISRQQVRRLALRKQLLTGAKLPRGKAGALAAIEALGYVQIDTINVIERAHHVTLFTRCPGYDPSHLHALHSRDARVFEYWAHAMCYVPMADYRFYRPYMEAFPARSSWHRQYEKKYGALAQEVLKRIRAEGPLSTSQFEDPRNTKRGAWWDWKPAKTALELLFYHGDLMVKERRGFTRVYDLTERVLPSWVNAQRPSQEDEQRFFARRALNGLGAGTIGDINKYIMIAGKLQHAVDQLVGSGEVREVRLEGSDKAHYILASDLAGIDARGKENDEVRILSPFDNAIILRDRVQRLFGFEYTLECYVPPAKRKFGYFCLPVLWQDQLIGRIDLKADRQDQRLLVQHLHYERGFMPDGDFVTKFKESLRRFAAFHECDGIRFSDTISRKVRNQLTSSR